MSEISHLSEGIRQTIWLFRTPETDWDRESFFYSSEERPLTEHGRNCVQNISKNLIALKLSKIISSKRADAAVLAESLRRSTKSTPPMEYDTEWSDINYGSWEGLNHAAAMSQNPGEFSNWKKDSWSSPAPDGESKEQASQRIIKAFNNAIDETDVGSIAIVTHAFPIQICICEALGYDPKTYNNFGIEQSSISILESTKDGFRLANMNFKLFGRDRTNPMGRDSKILK